MIARHLETLVRDRLGRSPAVALVGARQSGKTTLARKLGPIYFDLEQPGDRTRLDVEWDEVARGKGLVVLDEAQEWPEVFPRLRGAIDADRKRNGRFLLLGSISPSLMTAVSESLAGRLSIVELTPLTLPEVPRVPLRRLWLAGGYPDGGALGGDAFPRWQRDYLALLAQRDLPNWGLPAKPRTIERLLRMTAAVHGQTWNASKIGQSLGLSHTTVNDYVDTLEGAFLVRRLPPLAANLKKRLVKRPKLYWRDSGLVHAMLRVRDHDDLLSQPWVGASWEGFVIEQTIETLGALGSNVEASYFRTSDDYEIDLVLEWGRQNRWAIEVKLTSQPDPRDLDRLARSAAMIGAKRQFLISQTSRPAFGREQSSCGLRDFLEHLRESAPQ